MMFKGLRWLAVAWQEKAGESEPCSKEAPLSKTRMRG
jgi:hypothetical protein